MGKMLSALQLKCTACGKAAMFQRAKPFVLYNFGRMYPSCRLCNQSFVPEPGFYFGASYVSYAFGILLSVLTFVICYSFGVHAPRYQIMAIGIVLIVFAPYNFKMSRAMWLSWFVKSKKVK